MTNDNKDIKFVVDAENKVVVCVLENCSDIPIKRINKYIGKDIKLVNEKKFKIRDTYRGVAKCSDEDTFDEAIGKRLALTKAKKKRANAINKSVDLFAREMGGIGVVTSLFGYSKYAD